MLKGRHWNFIYFIYDFVKWLADIRPKLKFGHYPIFYQGTDLLMHINFSDISVSAQFPSSNCIEKYLIIKNIFWKMNESVAIYEIK